MKDYKIFYSWQSDSDRLTNSTAIRNALRASAINIEIGRDDDIRIIQDEATRDMPGSPDIPNTIFEKIRNADIFVCDITVINQNQSDYRKTPNPNVLIELGFAICSIGWERIILLNNEHISNIDDQPFDIKSKRISQFSIKNKDDNAGKGELTTLLKNSIETIILKNPPKSINNIVLSEEELKRDRDVRNLQWVLNQIHIPSIDILIEELPNFINNNVLITFEGFRSVFNNSLFSFYDQDLYENIKELFCNLNEALSYSRFYEPIGEGRKYKLTIDPSDPIEENVYEELNKIREKLKISLPALINIVREKYLEIDINKSSEFAYAEFERLTQE